MPEKSARLKKAEERTERIRREEDAKARYLDAWDGVKSAIDDFCEDDEADGGEIAAALDRVKPLAVAYAYAKAGRKSSP